MKTLQFLSLFLLLGSFSAIAQTFGKEYQIIPIRKPLKEILIENPTTSPLECYVACIYLWMQGDYKNYYSETIDCVCKNQILKQFSKQYTDELLHSTIEEMIIYKDSVGFITRKESDKLTMIGVCYLENGKWLFAGEDVCFSSNLSDVYEQISYKTQNIHYPKLLKYYQQSTMSTDTLDFIKCLQTIGDDPIEYLLKKLSNHKLVIYGEIHRRRVSWDLLKQLILTPQFSEICSTVFLELPHHHQSTLNSFMAANKLDTVLVMKILQDEQIYGWQDRGMYEFIITLWAINKKSKNKIQIIAVDEQVPWNTIKSREEYNYYVNHNLFDRDSTMANIIEKSIKFAENRNALFIVGMNHARKFSPDYPIKAGTLLAQCFQKNDIFSIMTHAMITNNANACGKIRYGFFDAIFEKYGNIPIAFDLHNTAFGNESFDAIQQVRFTPSTNNFEDFFDGYIFLCPLDDETYDYTLYELFTEEFIQELKRRASISESPNAWYDIPTDEISKEIIINKIEIEKDKYQNKRWPKF